MYWITDCKVCDIGTQFKVKTYRIDPAKHPDLMHLSGRYNIVTINLKSCLQCGFIYHDHVLSLDELQELYAREDRITHKKETLQKQVLLDRASNFLKQNYFFSRLTRVIDVGSGDFSLIDELSKHTPSTQFDAINVSFPLDYRGQTRVFRLMLEEMTEVHSYDLVILSHILEHIADFDAFFIHLKKITHKGTELYVEVPFQVGPALLLSRGFHAQHINYFTPLTLQRLLEKHGYCLERLEFDTEGGYVYYGIPGIIRAKFSIHVEKHPTGNKSVWYSTLFTWGYFLSPHVFIRGMIRRYFDQEPGLRDYK